MKTFKEYASQINESIIIEAKQLDREIFEGKEAIDLLKELDKDNNKRVQSRINFKGLEIDNMITKDATYIIYKDENNKPFRIIKNPNKQDIKDYKESLKA